MVKSGAGRNFGNKNSKIQDEFNNSTDDKVCVYETVNGEKCIKQELCDTEDESQSIYNDVNVKEEIIADATILVQETGLMTNITDSCERCSEEYDLYCLKCPMLIHVLDGNSAHFQDNRVRRTLPKNFVDICKTSSGVGIIALRLIPEGVVFGPFEGLNSIKGDAASKWKLKNNELVYAKDPKRLNWMQYIRRADRSSHRNLTPFQHEGKLYYRSDVDISVGDELLVCWDGDDEKDGIQDRGDGYWKPRVCEKLDDTYACTLCCVGYKSMCHLTAHNSRCPEKRIPTDFCEGIMRCPFCKIYMDEKEYSDYHMDRCCERNTKKYVATLSSPDDTDKLELKDDKYKCSMCEYSTSNKDRLGQHQLIHSDIRMYKCSECPYQVRTTSKLQKHVRKHANRGRSRYECGQCSERFTRADLFAMHQKREHSVSVYKCDKCVFESNNAGNLICHLGTHKDVKPYQCNACEKQFKTEISLLVHVKNVHNEKKEKYKCPICDYETIYRGSMKQHLSAVHSGVKRFQCHKCPFKTSYKKIIERHLRRHEYAELNERENFDTYFRSEQSTDCHEKKTHTIPAKTYSCCKCAYQTNRKYNFDQHLKAHDDVKLHACALCPFKTTTKQIMKRHVSVTHNDDRPFKCDACSQKFKEKYTLTTHVRRFHSDVGKTEYECPHCPFQTKYKASIEQHVNAHDKSKLVRRSKCDHSADFKENERCKSDRTPRPKADFNRHDYLKPFACTLCPHRSTTNWKLKRHIATHNEDKPFKCEACAQMFKSESSLTNHLRNIHSESEGSKYKCLQCPFETKYKASFLYHVNAHNKSVLFRCSNCDFNTYHMRTFNTHRKRHEKTETHAQINDECEPREHPKAH